MWCTSLTPLLSRSAAVLHTEAAHMGACPAALHVKARLLCFTLPCRATAASSQELQC